MTSRPTSSEAMNRLHNDVAIKLSAKINAEAPIDEEGNEIHVPEDPRWVGMAIKFLADNKTFREPDIENTLGELDKHLQKKRKRVFPTNTNVTDIATKQALQMNE